MPDPVAIEEAAALLSMAKKPLVLVGGGAVGCGASLTSIAEKLAAPVLASNAGKGILPESHPLSLGCSILYKPSQEALGSADVVLIVGSEVAEGDHFLPKLEIAGQIVRIDIDPTELVAQYPATVAIQSDAQAAMTALDAALETEPDPEALAEGKARTAGVMAENRAVLSPDERMHEKVWEVLRAAMPADTIVMGDMTQLVYTGAFVLPMEQERCWFYSGTYCALGVALPMAIGAKIGAPDRPVMAVAGDGGFMFTVNELAVAVQEKLALPVIVWNNDALKEIVDQMDRRQIPRVGVEPVNPDFTALAESFGCRAARPESAEELQKAVSDAFKAEGPTLIEIRQDSAWLAG